MTRNRAHHLRLLALCIFAALLALLAGIARGAPAFDSAGIQKVAVISQDQTPPVRRFGDVAVPAG